MDNKRPEPGAALSARVARPAGPLWRLAPGRDAQGRPLSDFLLLLPELRQAAAPVRDLVELQLRAVFAEFGERVVFAELNPAMQTLWVTVEGRPGLCLEVATAIRRRLPEARLISGLMPAPRPSGLAARLRDWLPAGWTARGWAPSFRARIRRPGGRLRGPGRPDNGPR